MKYALNIDSDGRILSATYPEFAPASAFVVDALPEGDITDYRYVNGEFVYDPLPEPEVPDTGPTQEERISALEEENAMLLECILEMSEIVYA